MTPEGIGGWPRRRRIKSGDHPALVFRNRVTTYAQLADRVDRLAVVLQARGVGRGDRVAFLGNNHAAFVETIFATGLLGAVFVPLNTRLSAPELSAQLADCAASLLIATEAFDSLADEADRTLPRIVVRDSTIPEADDYDQLVESAQPNELRAPTVTLDDHAVLIYTSGTTGRPKGAVLTHGNLTWNALNVVVDFDLASSDRSLMVSPLFHVASLGMGCLPVLLKGATVLLQERFVPGEALRAIEEFGATAISGVPTTYQLMAEDPAWATTDISSLRLMTCGGSAVPDRIRAAYEERGLAFSLGYGLTETSPGVTALLPSLSSAHPDTSGTAHFFTDFRIRDTDTGELADAGTRGEIEVLGPNVFAGYRGNEQATQDAFTADGWFKTGDIGVADADGFLTIVDRVKDMIISGGENIYSVEVEQAIAGIEGVTGVAVIGVPHERWGEVPHAVVTLADGATLTTERMVDFLATRLARYKVPRSLDIVDELPRTASGKVRKRILHDELLNRGAAGTP